MASTPQINESDLARAAALAKLCRRQWSSRAVRMMYVEDLVSTLRQSAPAVASVGATLLTVLGDEEGRQFGEEILRLVGEFDPDQLTISPPPPDNVDVILLTVKPIELRACLSAFGVGPYIAPRQLSSDGHWGWISETAGLRLGIAMVGAAGNLDTALTLGSLLNSLSASSAVLIGMCAGVRGKVERGDVVIAESVVAYEYQRITESGPVYQPRTYSVPQRRLQPLQTLTAQMGEEWQRDVRDSVRNDLIDLSPFDDGSEISEWRPSVLSAVVLAGARIIEDGRLPAFAEEVHGRAKAAEMEGAGFASAAEQSGVDWHIVRGVADFGEPERERHWQYPATYVAARLVRKALEQGAIGVGARAAISSRITDSERRTTGTV